jgi:hypothetical protein
MLWSRRFGGATRGLYVVASLAFVLTATAVVGAQQGPWKIVTVRSPMTGTARPALEGSAIVMPKPGVAPAQMGALINGMGAKIVHPLMHGRMFVVQLAPNADMQQGMDRIMGSGLAQIVEPNGIMVAYGAPRGAAASPLDRIAALPNDPMWDQQWGPQKINCPDAWDIQKGNPNVTIAIVDTGIDYLTSDLAGHTWTNAGEVAGDGIDNDNNGYVDDVYGWDFADNDNDPRTTGTDPVYVHGSHCAGIASADTDNGIGIAGVCWFARNMAVRVLGPQGGLDSWIIDGITYAVDNGADVINMSLGPPVPSYSAAYQPPIDAAFDAGVTVVCAAGNSDWEITTNPSSWFSPVCNDGNDPSTENHVLGVMATDVDDIRADFSNYGDAYTMMDICAPGVDILSTLPGDVYERWDGTSMACPHAVGAAALLVAQIGRNPAAIIEQIRDGALNIDDLNPLYAGKLGMGRLDVVAALGVDKPPAPATAVNAFDTANDEGGSITITWRRSADDGGGRNDVIGYELWRGVQPDPATAVFTRIADRTALPPRSSGYIDDTVTDGLPYYYFVRTFDASNHVDSTVAGPASSRDDAAPPPVDNLVAQDTQADNGRSITLSWVGYPGAPDITKFRVYRSESKFSDVTEDGVTLLLPEIDKPLARNYVDKAADPNADPSDPKAQPLDQTDYWYAVSAIDEADNEITAVTAAGPARCAPNLSITFSYGLRMITIPAEPIDPRPMAVLGLTDPTEADFARYDPLTQSYHVLAQAPDDPFLSIVPGRAYWLNRDIPTFIGVGGRVVDDPEYEVMIDQGWSQVGSPYDADYPFEGILVRDTFGTDTPITASNDVRKYGWRYDAFQRSYKLVSPLLPGADTKLPKREGMWLYAEVPGVKLVFANNVTVPAEAAAATPAKLDGWQIQLIARTADAADTDNFLGVTSQASAIGRIVGPPAAASGGVDLFFTAGGTDRLAADLRKTLGARAKWNVVVECAAAGTPVELSWPDLTTLPNDLRPVLKDLTTGRSVYMRTAAGYTYKSRAADEQRKFTITCPEAGAGELVLAQVAAAPVNAGGVELTYTLARPANVTVQVRNIAGRAVATLPAPNGQVGLNRVLWNGRSAAGQGVPNGQYLICITAVAQDNGEIASAVAAVTLQR